MVNEITANTIDKKGFTITKTFSNIKKRKKKSTKVKKWLVNLLV